MPVNYQYKRVSDGQVEDLSVVDEKMCEAVGIEPNTRRYCALFQALQITGLSIAGLSDGFTTSKEGFEAYKAKYPDAYARWDLVERFLVTEYNFTCWR